MKHVSNRNLITVFDDYDLPEFLGCLNMDVGYPMVITRGVARTAYGQATFRPSILRYRLD